MTKNNQSAFVQMPSSTVAALKAMLFNSTEGVDLSGIIDDIAGNHSNKNLVAINVALAFNGYKTELDNTARILNWWKYDGTIKTGQMVNLSLITNTVEVICANHTYNTETKQWTTKENGIETISLEDWYNYDPAEGDKRWDIVATMQKETAKKDA